MYINPKLGPMPHIRRKISVLSEVSLRTVEHYFLGKQLQPLSVKRIEDVLRANGMLELIRPPVQPPARRLPNSE
jgi:hypothetical protein